MKISNKIFGVLCLVSMANASDTFYIQYCNFTAHPISYINTAYSSTWSDPGTYNDTGHLASGRCSNGNTSRTNQHRLTPPYWNTTDNNGTLVLDDMIVSYIDNYPISLNNNFVKRPWFAGLLGLPIYLSSPYTFYLSVFTDSNAHNKVYYSFVQPPQKADPDFSPTGDFSPLPSRSPTMDNQVNLTFNLGPTNGIPVPLYYSLFNKDSKTYITKNQAIVINNYSF